MGLLNRIQNFFATRSPREAIRQVEELKNRILALAGETSPFSADAKEAYYSLVSAYELYSRGKNETVPQQVNYAKNRAAQCASYLKKQDPTLANAWEKAVTHAANLIWTTKPNTPTTLPELSPILRIPKDKELSDKRARELQKHASDMKSIIQKTATYYQNKKGNDLVRAANLKSVQDAMTKLEEALSSLKNNKSASDISLTIYHTWNFFTSIIEDLVRQKDRRADELARETAKLLHLLWIPLCEEAGTRATRWQHKITLTKDTCTLVCAACDKTAATFAVGQAPMNQGVKIVYNGSTGTATLDTSHKTALFSLLETGNLAGANLYVRSTTAMSEGIDVYCVECDKAYCPDHFTTREEYDDGFYDYTNGTCPLGHTRKIDD